MIKWSIARVCDNEGIKGEVISSANFDIRSGGWFDAVVPGTFLTSYEAAGKIDDPYFSDNILKLDKDYYNKDHWYRGVAEIPMEYEGRHIFLNFGGVNKIADVYVNGELLGSIEGAFRRGIFDITDKVKAGEKAYIAVYIHWCLSTLLDTPTFIGSEGWDFIPDIPGRNMGIYREVYLSTTGDAVLSDPFLKTKLSMPDMKSAALNLSFDLENLSNEEKVFTVYGRITPEGICFEKSFTLEAGEKRTVCADETVIEEPRLWWPNGYGEPELYKYELTVIADGEISDSTQFNFGIRDFRYDREGKELVVTVNGVKVMNKGGNWGFPDAMLKHSDQFIYDSVRLHKEMNMTVIRTWHSNSDFEVFYDACDKYGILVFEDFALHGKKCPHDPKMFMESARDKIKRLRNRACIFLWCGENEAVPPVPLDVELPAAVEELDGTRLYIAASNCDGVHGGVAYTIQDPAWYFGQASGYTTEVGAMAVPNIESMRRMMKEEELWPAGNAVWAHHDYNFGIGNKNSQKYTDEINARYGKTDNIEDFCKKAQLINLETYRATFEAWNDKLFDDCSGLLLWMTAPAWPSLIWQTYDYYLDCFGTYFGSKTACEPKHIQWNPLKGKIKAINNSPEDFDCIVETEVYDLNGKKLYAEEVKATAKAESATEVGKLFNPTGVDVATGKRAWASSLENERDIAANAFDGGDVTRWTSSGQDTEWIAVDLGEETDIDGVFISWENAYARAFDIEVSNDSEIWTTVASVKEGKGGLNTVMFDAVKTRYVRVHCREKGTMWSYSIYKIFVYKAGTSASGIDGLTPTHFIKLRMRDMAGNLISENFYWRSLRDCDYTAMADMAKTKLTLEADCRSENGKTYLDVNVKNTGENIAVCIRIKAADANITCGDDRILPTIYSDNYFSLLIGEEKKITIEIPADNVDIKLLAEGYNTEKTEISC